MDGNPQIQEQLVRMMQRGVGKERLKEDVRKVVEEESEKLRKVAEEVSTYPVVCCCLPPPLQCFSFAGKTRRRQIRTAHERQSNPGVWECTSENLIS